MVPHSNVDKERRLCGLPLKQKFRMLLSESAQAAQ
jgi:hypothetical protein